MAHAAPGYMEWQNSYGENGSEYGVVAFQNADGGYTLIGDTDSFGYGNIYVVKTGPNGEMESQKNYGRDYGQSSLKQPTRDGGYIIIGVLLTGDDEQQMTLDKYDANGTREWQIIYGSDGPGSFTGGNYVLQTSDGGYIVTGSSGYHTGGTISRAFLLKLTANGTTEWEGGYGLAPGPGSNSAGNGGDFVQQTEDGGYILVGLSSTLDYGNRIYVVKTDAYGGEEWERLLGYYDAQESICETPDGGYIIISYDHWTKIDSNGHIEWDSYYGGSEVQIYNGYVLESSYRVRTITEPGNGTQASLDYSYANDYNWGSVFSFGGTGDESANSLMMLSERKFIIVGSTTSFGNGAQAYIADVEFSESGPYLAWMKTFGGRGDESANYVMRTSDGGYAIVGNSTSFGGGVQAYLVKTDPDGNLEWQGSYGGSGDDSTNYVMQTADGDFVIAGSTTSFGNGMQAYLAKVSNSITDTNPPVTSIALTGKPGNDGWYVSDVVVILNADDTGGSGVNYTYFSLDGGPEQIYDGPFYIRDGQHTLIYGSVDGAGNDANTKVSVNVDTLPPAIGVVGLPEVVPVNSSTYTNASFSEPHVDTATWSWGDGAASDGMVGGDAVNGSHVYARTGSYTVALNVTDLAGNTGSSSGRIAVFDPKIYAYGIGRLTATEGSYAADPAFSGTGSLMFTSQYARNPTSPTGLFVFHLDNMTFIGLSYDWLVADERSVQIRGNGTMDHKGRYPFELNMTRGISNQDIKIRLVIRDSDGGLVFDDRPGVPDDAIPASTFNGYLFVGQKAKDK